MMLLYLLATLVSADAAGFLNDIFRSHPVSTTSRYDLKYPVRKYDLHPSTYTQMGRVITSTTRYDLKYPVVEYEILPRLKAESTFWGMPPPADSPFMGSTQTPILVTRELASDLPMRDEPWRAETTEHYGTERYSSSYPSKRFSAGWRDQNSFQDSTEKAASKEGSDWSLLGLFGKETQAKTNTSEKWCNRYKSKCRSAKSSGSNGLLVRITGGQPAKPKEHPHMVMIGYGAKNNRQWLCGGSLVSSRYILSAAHCVNTPSIGAARWALLGELDISTTAEDAQPQEREIVERIIHPEYKEPAVYHDIALFKMDREVVFNAWIAPVCLHTASAEGTRVATVTGWGRTNFVSETSPVLMEVDVNIFNSSFCKQTVDESAGVKMPRGYDSNTMICAGEERGGKDACQGDSGGPLVVDSGTCTKLQIGITSVGRECGLPYSPGVYTRVSYYVSWLEDIIWR